MGKNYVSYHLMSVHMREVKISAELQKRRQGKACFNFASVDEKLFKEMDKLTASGLKDYRPEVLEKRSQVVQREKSESVIRFDHELKV